MEKKLFFSWQPTRFTPEQMLVRYWGKEY